MADKAISVIGSYAVGMTISADHFPIAGETVMGSNFMTLHGGKGSNQAVAVSRLGAKVLYGTCVGKDGFGDKAIALYQEEGIDASFVRRSESGRSTGVGIVIVNSDGENEIVIDFGANNEFSPEDFDGMLPAIKGTKMLLMQLEMDLGTTLHAAKRCRQEGIKFVLNPAPFQKLPKELLQCCDFLTPNQTEGRQLLGLDCGDPISDEQVAIRLRQELGVSTVVLTLGSGGALIADKERLQRVEGIRVSPVDTTGAGDTFTAALCVAMSEGKDICSAVRFANIAAGLAVTKYGVVESIPTRGEVEKYITDKGVKV